ncbi:MAG: DUF3810 domain-containing protein [Clostridium sp.]|nr:DUF3810 domain-containing protein [Clostridium sp.]
MKPKKKMKIPAKKRQIVFLGIAGFVLLMNLLAWCSRTFSDAYIAHIFPLWVQTYGRFTGLFPFSVGECLIAAGLLLVFAAVCIGLAFAVYHKPSRFRNFVGKFYEFFAWVLLGIWLVMTLNCVILYHASTFAQKYFSEDSGDYTLEELFTVRNYVAEQCNLLAAQMERDDAGRVLYQGSASASGGTVDMRDKSREVMQNLGASYPRLKGYYPRPKPLFCSDFMCQQYMQGYFFPFSMEANYNDVMMDLNKPATMCHELAHLKGFIYEDEASFISYLACIQSDDLYFQYSGYLSVLTYLENDLYRISKSSPEAFSRAREQTALVEVSSVVWQDDIFVEQEDWERINQKALVDTETVNQVTDTFLDANLKIHGVSDGAISYTRVVTLLLQYYRTQQAF